MVSQAVSIGLLAVAIATLYWVTSSEAMERLWAMITGERALAFGTFMGGLIWGNLLIKALVGFIGGMGVLALGDVTDVGPTGFGIGVGLIILGLALTRNMGDDDE